MNGFSSQFHSRHYSLPVELKFPSWRDKDPAPVEGEGTPALASGLTLSTTAGELEFGILLVGEIGNIGAPRVRPPGDSADDSEEGIVSSIGSDCDDGETRGILQAMRPGPAPKKLINRNYPCKEKALHHSRSEN